MANLSHAFDLMYDGRRFRRPRHVAQGGFGLRWLIVGIAGVAALVALVFAADTFIRGIDKRAYERGKAEVQLEFNVFKAMTAQAGLKADGDRREADQKNLRDKEKADGEIKNLRSERDAARRELRVARAGSRASGGVLPGAEAGAGGSETITFDRALLERALREFVEEVDGVVAEGDEARDTLDAVKRWAK